MTSGAGISAAAVVLERARGFRREADLAEAHLLSEVLAWAELHVTEDPSDAAVWDDSPVHLGGEGCPWVREFTVTEIAAALGLSPAAGRRLVAEVLELAFRLPRLWEQVQSGRLQAWKARRVAARTQGLTVEAAGFVDRQVADCGRGLGPTRLDRLVEDAIGRYMPAEAERQAATAEDRRFLAIHHDQPSFSGTARIEGEIGIADAMDIDAALSHIAEQLKDAGSDLSLDERRALAAGELARRQFVLDFDHDPAIPDQTTVTSVSEREQANSPRSTAPPRRQVVLYAHLSADAVNAMTTTDPAGAPDPNAVVRLEGYGGQLITLDTLRDWLTIDGDTRVTIRPVLDLNARLVSAGRFASDLQREQIHLRDRTCAAPYCERPARRLDADHIEAWDDDGPPGQTGAQTNSDNLGSLCRHHHRAKTLTGWTYTQLLPGVFSWRSPTGLRFLTWQGQTIDLNH